MSSRRLWLAVLIGPIAWVAYLQAAYALVPSACQRPARGMIVLLAAGMVVLALSSAGLVAAWQAWQRLGPTGSVSSRVRVIALTGIGSTAVFVLVVVAGMLPVLLLAPCG